MITWLLALVILVALNVWATLAFWYDKRRAQAGERRVPEADLLMLALVGGSPGALFGRWLFRHKTRKEPFSTQLLVITALQIGAIIGLAIAFV